MIRISILISFLFISLCAFSQQWIELNLDAAARYDDVYFLDTDTGWAVNSSGEIFKTENGGYTWLELYTNSNYYFRSVEFINGTIGFAGTLNSVLLKTEDGGNTWFEIQNLVPNTFTGICGLSHVNDNVYGVGIFSYPAYFIKSIDQGLSWSYTDLSGMVDGLVECHFLDENIGFAGGIKENIGGVVLKTMDGGTTWSEVFNSQNGTEYVWKLDFVTDQIVYAAIASLIGTPRIAKSIDGGNNWTTFSVDSMYLELQGIGFIDENIGWVCPRNEPMYQTTDGGQTWNVDTSLYENINRIYRLNPNLMYASGSSVYKYVDTITYVDTVIINDTITHIDTALYVDTITYTDTVIDVTSVTDPSKSPPFHSIVLKSNNPFGDKLAFSMELIKQTNVRLDLFDAAGKKVKDIRSGSLDEGAYAFSLNTQDLSSGAYYLVLRSNEGFVSLLVVKENK